MVSWHHNSVVCGFFSGEFLQNFRRINLKNPLENPELHIGKKLIPENLRNSFSTVNPRGRSPVQVQNNLGPGPGTSMGTTRKFFDE